MPGENVSQIFVRKQKEVDATGFSLWAANIKPKSKEIVWQLEESDMVLVLCHVNKNAKDPSAGRVIAPAISMYSPATNVLDVPGSISATFTKGKNYQAYVVERYIELDAPVLFDFGCYECFFSDGRRKDFKDVFVTGQYTNFYGRYTPALGEHAMKEISVIMKLRYPFVVDVFN